MSHRPRPLHTVNRRIRFETKLFFPSVQCKYRLGDPSLLLPVMNWQNLDKTKHTTSGWFVTDFQSWFVWVDLGYAELTLQTIQTPPFRLCQTSPGLSRLNTESQSEFNDGLCQPSPRLDLQTLHVNPGLGGRAISFLCGAESKCREERIESSSNSSV